MSSPDNPFLPPASDAISFGTQRVEYEVVVRAYDLRCRIPLVLRLILLAVFAGHAWIFLVVSGMAFRAPQPLLFVGIVLLGPFAWLAYRFLGPGIANARIAAMPHLLGIQQGTLDHEWVTRENSMGSSRYKACSCTHAVLRGDVLELAFDQNLMTLNIIPARCIPREDLNSLLRTFRAYALERKQYRGSIADQRLLEGRCIDVPSAGEAISFSGVLNASDVGHLQSQVARAQKKVLLFLFGFLAFVTFISLSSGLVLIPATAGFVVAFILLRRLRSIRKLSGKKSQPIMKVEGSISASQLVMSTPLSCSLTPLEQLTFCGVHRDVLGLGQPGSSGAMVLIPRRFFATESDWQSAAALARAACSQSSALQQ